MSEILTIMSIYDITDVGFRLLLRILEKLAMSKDKIEFFVHLESEAEPRIVEAESGATLLSALNEAGIPVTDDLHIFVGDWQEGANTNVLGDDAEDSHEPEDWNKRLCDCELGHPAQLHCVRCRRVRVTVEYNGKERRRSFSPAASIGVVTVWAHRIFRVDCVDAANFVLQFCDSNQMPSVEATLGQLVKDKRCVLCFDLVPKDRIEGIR